VESRRAELKENWSEFHLIEMQIAARRSQLIEYEINLVKEFYSWFSWKKVMNFRTVYKPTSVLVSRLLLTTDVLSLLNADEDASLHAPPFLCHVGILQGRNLIWWVRLVTGSHKTILWVPLLLILVNFIEAVCPFEGVSR